MNAEEWRPISGLPGYEVSSLGRVRSWRTHRGIPGPRVLKASAGSKEYLTVRLAGATQKVHRLVAEAFLGPLPSGLQTRHLDGNNQNNRAANLAYGTQLENMADRVSLKDRCTNGHLFEGENLFFPSHGGRGCRTCARDADKRRRDRSVA